MVSCFGFFKWARVQCVITVAAFVLSGVSPAVAQTLPAESQATTQGSGDSPITVSRLLTTTNGAGDWATCIDFTNTSLHSASAIQFLFTYWDAFDTKITDFRADRVGEFSPNVLVQGPQSIDEWGAGNLAQKLPNCWKIGAVVGSLSKVTAEVAKVRYADGTIWVAPVPRKVFSAPYMASGGFVDPPKELRCRGMGILSGSPMKWWWFEKYGHKSPPARACVEKWEAEHGPIAGWSSEPIPAATPSPVPLGTP